MTQGTVKYLPPSTGVDFAMDDANDVWYQQVKLTDPTIGSTTGIGIAANPLRTDPTGTTTQPVSVATLPLPSGAATQATLAALLAELQAKADLTQTQPTELTGVTISSNRLAVAIDIDQPTRPTDTQPVSAASLPLPAGASTAALQTTGNTSLGSLLTELALKADLTETQPTSLTGVTISSGRLAVSVDISQPLTDTQLRATAVKMQQPQIVDSGNSAFRTVAEGAAQFVGAWYATRSVGIVRQLVVLASNVTSGLGGTFVFEFGEDGSTAVISESRTLTDFATVRDFDLINAGAFFRVKWTPSRALTGAEFVAINTTQRTQNDGAFVRLANQEIEEANAAMGQTFSYQKAFDPNTGKSVNIRPGATVTGNSSTTPLTSAASFNASGSYFSLDNIAGITISVTTDQSGTLFVDNAMDSAGASVVRTSSFTVTGGTPFFIGLSPLARFMRIRYTNGAVAQTTFLLQTNTKVTPVSPTFQRADTSLADASILLNTKSIISGRTGAGSYLNVPVNSQGNLITADWRVEVQKGNVAGHSWVNQSGRNPDIDTTTETIFGVGGIYTPPASAAVLTFAVNVLDSALGLTAFITGLSSGGVIQTETLALNATVKTSALTYSSLQSVLLSGATPPGFDITTTIGATTVSTIPVGSNASQLGYYHVPTGKTAYLTGLTTSSSNNSASSRQATLMHRSPSGSLFREIAGFGGHSNGAITDVDFAAPYIFLAGSVIRIDMVCGANNNIANCVMEILLVDN